MLNALATDMTLELTTITLIGIALVVLVAWAVYEAFQE